VANAPPDILVKGAKSRAKGPFPKGDGSLVVFENSDNFSEYGAYSVIEKQESNGAAVDVLKAGVTERTVLGKIENIACATVDRANFVPATENKQQHPVTDFLPKE
jgi:hypothetical protein